MSHKTLLSTISLLTAALSCSGGLLMYEPFNSEIGQIPAGWTGDNYSTPTAAAIAARNDDLVQEGSLSVAGLAPSTGGSWRQNNSAYQYYRSSNFLSTPMVNGETVYYSFMLQVNDISSLSTSGGTSSLMGLSNSSATSIGNNGVATIGLRKDSEDDTKFNISVDGDFRGPSNAQSIKIPGAFATGEVIFIVASYTRGSGTTSVANFWINPDLSSFGAGSAPTATATDSARGVDVQAFLVASTTTVGFQPNEWVIDELRIGTSWADVTPAIPEPSSIAAVIALGSLALAFARRRR